ncbi:MAG: glycosyltransferase family 2 protein [Chitinophagaceae bacterium]
MDITILIPLLNEAESISELYKWIKKVCEREDFSHEIIFVDDGSTDNSWEVIESLQKKDVCVRGVRFQRNYGKAAGLDIGFKEAKGDIVITMDADLQDSPEEIVDMRKMILTQGYDLVSGWKKKRYDNKVTKNIPSKLYNSVTSKMSGIQLHDFNCGIKAYKKKVIKTIDIQGDMHRYIPVIAKWNGFKKIGEKVVEHRPRKYGVSKFGWERFPNGFLDLCTIMFISKFAKRPMHFFGLLGVLFLLIGLFSTAYLIYMKFYESYNITNRASFFIAIATIIIGFQMFLTGFLAELIIRNSDKSYYTVAEKI